jgi:hypothetical protein
MLCLFASTAMAQYGPYHFDHWTMENGLPQNTVNTVAQTRDGYVWVTTFDGLARFDGVRFTVFDKGNSRGINSNRFIQLYETADGTLLLGTEDAGITIYRHGIFNSYTTADGLPSDHIFGISPGPFRGAGNHRRERTHAGPGRAGDPLCDHLPRFAPSRRPPGKSVDS